MIDAKAIIRRYGPRVGFVALLCVGAVLTLKLGEVALGLALGSGPSYEDGRADQRAATLRETHHRDLVRLKVMSDSAAKARIVYVARRGDARAAIAALPPAEIRGDTLTIPAGVFVVQHPVAEYIGGLRLAVAKSDTAMTAGDTAIAKTVAVAALTDSTAAQSDTLATIAEEKAEGHKPGLLSRAWSAVKSPVIFVAGATLGVVVARVVP